MKLITLERLQRFAENFVTSAKAYFVAKKEGYDLSKNDYDDAAKALVDAQAAVTTTTGTYTKVTVNDHGQVTAVENPTTLDGYNIAKVEVDKLDGVISVDHLPKTALERLSTVVDNAALLALTAEDVQNGDSVRVATYTVTEGDKTRTRSNVLFVVADDTKLGTMDAFVEYTSNVDWASISNVPDGLAGGIEEATTDEIDAIPGFTTA